MFSKRCVEFVALGPKNYGYLLKGEDSPVVKVRGLSFNQNSSRKHHFNLMKQIADESLRINCDESLSLVEKEALLIGKIGKITAIRPATLNLKPKSERSKNGEKGTVKKKNTKRYKRTFVRSFFYNHFIFIFLVNVILLNET